MDETVTYSWALESTKDRVGNEMTIEYVPHLENSRFTELLPKTIHYSPGRTISLFYDDEMPQPDGAHPSPAYRFVSGLGLATTRVLTRIQMFGPNPMGAGLLRDYRITYKMNANVTLRPLLSSVQECDGAGACLTPTTFDWDEGQWSFRDVPLENPSSLVAVADLNGDGKDDIVSPLNYRFGTANGFGPPVNFNFPTQFGNPVALVSARPIDVSMNGRPLLMARIGQGDFKLEYNPITGKLEQGPHFLGEAPPGIMLTFVADLNGDGLPDIIDNVGRYYLNVGGIFGDPTTPEETLTILDPSPHTQQVFYGQTDPTQQSYVADFDATGRNAILFRNEMSGLSFGVTDNHLRILRLETQIALGSPGFPSTTGIQVHSVLTPLLRGDDTAAGFRYLMVDVNGDGNADAVQVPNSGGSFRLALNNGSNFEDLTDLTHIGGVDPFFSTDQACDPGLRIADINDDGLQDFLQLGSTRQFPPQAYVSAGTIGFSMRLLEPLDPQGHPLPPGDIITVAVPGHPFGYFQSQVLDANGDGLIDIIQPVNGQLHLYLREGKKPDQIKGIHEGQGKSYSIDYRSMQDAAFHPIQPLYRASQACTYPQYCTRRGMWLVADYSVTGDNDETPGSRTRTFSYTYADARSDLRGRGFIGMGARRELDEQTGTAVLTIADNTSHVGDEALGYPFAGLIRKQAVATRLDSTSFTYRVVSTTHDYGRTAQGSGVAASVQPPYSVRPTRTERKVMDSFLRQLTDAGEQTEEELIITSDMNGILTLLPTSSGLTSTIFSDVTTTFDTYDDFNNLTQSTTSTAGGEVTLYRGTYANQIDPTTYILGMQTRSETTSTTPSAESKTRVVTYVPNLQTGLPLSMTVQPDTPNPEETVTVAYERNDFGQVTKITSTPLDSTQVIRTKRFEYLDGDGVFPSSAFDSKENKTEMLYHPGLGVLTFERDPNHVTTVLQYDGFGRLRVRATDGQGPLTVSYWHPTIPGGIVVLPTAPGVILRNGLGMTIQQAGAARQTVLYNELGHPYVALTRFSDVSESIVETTYTGVLDGQIGAISRPFYSNVFANRLLTQYHYDALGRIHDEIQPNDSTTTFTYSGLNQTKVDPRGNSTATLFDELGRVVSVREPLEESPFPTFANFGVLTDYTYGPFNTVKQIDIKDFNVSPLEGTQTTLLRTTTMTYDNLGRRKHLNDPEAGPSDRTYNAFGEVVQERMGDPATMPAGQVETIVYTRDALGRVTAETPSSESASTFIWDIEPFGIGRLASSTSSDGTQRGYSYDTSGRLRQERWTIDDAANPYVVDYFYDDFGRLGQVKYPTVAGRTRFSVNYHYDARGVADAVCDGRTTQAGFCDPSRVTPLWKATARLADGQITSEAFANGEITERQYIDGRGLVTKITSSLNGIPSQLLSYDYDPNGNLQTRSGVFSGAAETFTYDALNRLTTVTRPGQNSSTFTYDDLGNFQSRTNKDAGGSPTSQLTYSFTPGATPHQDLLVNGTPYAFDGKGRNTRVGPSSAPERETIYTPFDLPRQISVAGGTQQWTFQYDAEHRRVLKFKDPTHWAVTAGDWYEKNNDFAVAHVFFIHGPERVVAQLEVDTNGSDQFLYMHDDHLGSVDTFTDQQGLVNKITYDVFGTRTPSQSFDVRRGFTFHSHDDDITVQASDPGLIDMRGRVYDPKIGRFMTADPIVSAPFLSQGHNRYAYVLNNPLAYVDPFGFQEQPPQNFFQAIGHAIASAAKYVFGGSGSNSSSAPATPASTGAAATPQGGSAAEQGRAIAAAQGAAQAQEAGRQTSANGPAGSGSPSAPVIGSDGPRNTTMGGGTSGNPGAASSTPAGSGAAAPGTPNPGGPVPGGPGSGQGGPGASGPGGGPGAGGGPGPTSARGLRSPDYYFFQVQAPIWIPTIIGSFQISFDRNGKIYISGGLGAGSPTSYGGYAGGGYVGGLLGPPPEKGALRNFMTGWGLNVTGNANSQWMVGGGGGVNFSSSGGSSYEAGATAGIPGVGASGTVNYGVAIH